MFSFLGPILGVLGSLFKGKKTQQAPQQTPQQQAAYTQLLKMLMQRNKQGGDPRIQQMFYGQQGQQTTRPPIAQAPRVPPQAY